MKKLVGFDKSVIFFNNTIIAKRFENIIISVLYARPPVLIKAWLRADRVLWITHRATEVSQYKTQNYSKLSFTYFQINNSNVINTFMSVHDIVAAHLDNNSPLPPPPVQLSDGKLSMICTLHIVEFRCVHKHIFHNKL